MMTPPQIIKWYIGHYPKFRLSYRQIKPEHQWKINHILNDLRFYPDPRSYAKKAQCETLEVPNKKDYFVLDVGKDGTGNTRIKLLIYIDRDHHAIWPIYCAEK